MSSSSCLSPPPFFLSCLLTFHGPLANACHVYTAGRTEGRGLVDQLAMVEKKTSTVMHALWGGVLSNGYILHVNSNNNTYRVLFFLYRIERSSYSTYNNNKNCSLLNSP